VAEGDTTQLEGIIQAEQSRRRVLNAQGTHYHHDFIYLCCTNKEQGNLMPECKTQWFPLRDVLAILSVPEDVERMVVRLLQAQSVSIEV
jgi:hypothetical protein